MKFAWSWMQEPVRLRQVAFAADDLAKAEDTLYRSGPSKRQMQHHQKSDRPTAKERQTAVVGSEVIYRDPNVSKWGLMNILLPLGQDIIEVVAPTNPKEPTPVSRFLDKRKISSGGYMLIMQCRSARQRLMHLRNHFLRDTKKDQVIFQHHDEKYSCVQYHPRIVPGGVIPELDSQVLSISLTGSDFETASKHEWVWHACGPNPGDYLWKMRKHDDLVLKGVTVRLDPNDDDVEGAAGRWETIFGVRAEKADLMFTNARVTFVKGRRDMFEGIESVTVGVKGREKFMGILGRAAERHLCGDGWIDMVGVKWYFELLSEERHEFKAHL